MGSKKKAANSMDSKQRTGYTLFGAYNQWRSGVGMWVDVVEQVYSRHEPDFLKKAKELRLSPDSERILISDNPQDMKRSRKTGIQGLYIYRNLKVDVFIDLSYELLRWFGHPPADLQIHEE